MANQDLSQFLRDWPYEPGQVSARLVTTADGEQAIQLRVDLGVLQMRLDGRPDGLKPNGYESYLDYYEDQVHAQEIEREISEDEEPAGTAEPDEAMPSQDQVRFLTPEDARILRDEAVQYYHRYVALLAVEDFDRVVRDTTRNLRVLDFCAAHAEEESDRVALEQFRSYVTMLRARAMAGRALRDNEPRAALVAIDEGLESLRRIYDAVAPEHYETSGEVLALRSLRDALLPQLPVSQTTELRARLAKAIEEENYELAAILRDEIRQIKE